MLRAFVIGTIFATLPLNLPNYIYNPMKFLIFLSFSTILFFSCKKDNSTCDNATVTYTKQIKPLFSSCAISACHNASSTAGSLANYVDAKKFAENGRILGSIKHEEGYKAMPEGGTKLSDCNISKIEKWINTGYPE